MNKKNYNYFIDIQNCKISKTIFLPCIRVGLSFLGHSLFEPKVSIKIVRSKTNWMIK